MTADRLGAAERYVDSCLPSGESAAPIGRGGIGVPSVGGILMVASTLCFCRVDDGDGAAVLVGDEGDLAVRREDDRPRGRGRVLIRPTTFSWRVSIGDDLVVCLRSSRRRPCRRAAR